MQVRLSLGWGLYLSEYLYDRSWVPAAYLLVAHCQSSDGPKVGHPRFHPLQDRYSSSLGGPSREARTGGGVGPPLSRTG